jgi:hypothetical protein
MPRPRHRSFSLQDTLRRSFNPRRAMQGFQHLGDDSVFPAQEQEPANVPQTTPAFEGSSSKACRRHTHSSRGTTRIPGRPRPSYCTPATKTFDHEGLQQLRVWDAGEEKAQLGIGLSGTCC